MPKPHPDRATGHVAHPGPGFLNCFGNAFDFVAAVVGHCDVVCSQSHRACADINNNAAKTLRSDGAWNESGTERSKSMFILPDRSPHPRQQLAPWNQADLF
jgi:hypothetical protein